MPWPIERLFELVSLTVDGDYETFRPTSVPWLLSLRWRFGFARSRVSQPSASSKNQRSSPYSSFGQTFDGELAVLAVWRTVGRRRSSDGDGVKVTDAVGPDVSGFFPLLAITSSDAP